MPLFSKKLLFFIFINSCS